jgi:hypothetical protein
MTRYDVFNGDADGICALLQLRLAAPADAVLVTGAKRDIALLERVDARAGDAVTVLDVSADTNRVALASLLERGVAVEYFDHHDAETLPTHRGCARTSTGRRRCARASSSIVTSTERSARGPSSGAYGDNLTGPARACADALGLDDDQGRKLRELGDLLSYNAYGDAEADLVVAPERLYRALVAHRDPFAFLRDAPECRSDRAPEGGRTRPWRRSPDRTRRSPAPSCTCCPTRRGRGACAACWPTTSPTASRASRTR